MLLSCTNGTLSERARLCHLLHFAYSFLCMHTFVLCESVTQMEILLNILFYFCIIFVCPFGFWKTYASTTLVNPQLFALLIVFREFVHHSKHQECCVLLTMVHLNSYDPEMYFSFFSPLNTYILIMICF